MVLLNPQRLNKRGIRSLWDVRTCHWRWDKDNGSVEAWYGRPERTYFYKFAILNSNIQLFYGSLMTMNYKSYGTVGCRTLNELESPLDLITCRTLVKFYFEIMIGRIQIRLFSDHVPLWIYLTFMYIQEKVCNNLCNTNSS